MSVLILGVVATAAVQLFSATMTSDNKAHRMALASALLQNEIEYVRTMSGINTGDSHYSSIVTSTKNGVTTTTGRVLSSQGTIMPNCEVEVDTVTYRSIELQYAANPSISLLERWRHYQ